MVSHEHLLPGLVIEYPTWLTLTPFHPLLLSLKTHPS